MAQPYVGEIRMFAGNFAPAGWMFCEGQLLPISEYETLFNLIGTTYGGDGQSTFGLPDLRGRIPLHFGSGFILAETGGVETVTLTISQIPAHTHALLASTANGDQTSPLGNVPANSFNVTPYINDVANGSMAASAISAAGGSQPHNNFQPYLCVDFIISLFGIFPSPT
jgi:microcystin-dependent protein